ncbi:hypothetical protein HYT53_01305 [Candidatus Woesearchaeota archaeon]|nr:hypothetical protein [Candidatus Woesearchaeota archaeon]
MKSLNKKIINASILLIALIVLFSTITYAKPFTDVLRDSLTRINDFFAQENYKPYAKTIDFFIFSIIFISIYLIGVRYAFKEVKRPEQAVAIVLGFTTAFLFVLRDYSITSLLPYMQYLLYAFIFVMWMLVLKGIKSKFWRFVLALLLTLLTIGLVQWLYGLLSPPEIGAQITQPAFLGGLSKSAGDFFKSFGDSFKGMDFQPPEVPSSVKMLGEGPPVVGPTPATGAPSTSTPAPATTAEEQKRQAAEAATRQKAEAEAAAKKAAAEAAGAVGGASFYKPWTWGSSDTSWYNAWYIWTLIGLLPFILTNRNIGGRINTKLGMWGAIGLSAEAGLETSIMIDQINKTIKEKEERMDYIRNTHELKSKLITLGENKEKLLEQLEKASSANLWTNEGRKLIKKEHPILNELLATEETLRYQLKALMVTEDSFLSRLDGWKSAAPQQYTEYLKKLVENIRKTISVYGNLEKGDEDSTKELEQLMKEGKIEELVHGKFKNVKGDWNKLQQYNEYEQKIIRSLEGKIKRQIVVLQALEGRVIAPKTGNKQKAQEKNGKPQPGEEHPKYERAA